MPARKQLQKLWITSLVIGALALGASLLWVTSAQGPGFDWIWAVAAFGVAAVVYNISFFLLCSVFSPDLSKLVTDDTEVQGDDVTHVVKYTETGDQDLDDYIRTYATARGITAVAIVSVIVTAVALIFFN